jgi:hypothetical protein
MNMQVVDLGLVDDDDVDLTNIPVFVPTGAEVPSNAHST